LRDVGIGGQVNGGADSGDGERCRPGSSDGSKAARADEHGAPCEVATCDGNLMSCGPRTSLRRVGTTGVGGS
jgi:hypothetical protein